MLTLIIYTLGNRGDLKIPKKSNSTLSLVEALNSKNLLTSLLKSLSTAEFLAAEDEILNTLEALS